MPEQGYTEFMTIAGSIASAIMSMGSSITETIYYTASGDSEATLTGHVFRNMEEDSNHPRGAIGMSQFRMLYIKSSDISSITPNADTCRIKWNIDDTTYTSCTTKQIVKSDEGSWTLKVVRGA